ncbi:glucosamine-6-phosphate deaminase [Robertmurraya kyonggiensis]|uniref:Glucosamine-6-phosphate deaminase n=1 Tax=Robertmurraya kyonggiensis TaxID=1037680 RepID=A0A4U1D4G4_9BACI|nr:glucosamine-6-phosphate deaminase [Robertmurraya kyonggiensis]TKC16127.1 glucosamine-6-phosphate deaminase [Robertmurraya kyonggiensis]
MKLITVKNYDEMSQKASSFILDLIQSKENPVLGLATGSTPEGLYRYLIEAYKEGKASFQHVTTFNLDEYVGIERADANSYYSFMQENFFKHVDISPSQTFLPNGKAADLQAECEDYEQLISNASQIDIQVLGLGLNGHIGFNEPGTPFSIRTHVVDLEESTREANSRFFESIDEVPTQAITMGIGTIMESKMILLLVSGEQKAEALVRLFTNEVSEEFPASILQNHPNVVIIADEAASKHLSK